MKNHDSSANDFHDEKSKTRQEMADELGFSVETLHRRLKKKGYIMSRELINPKQQNEIRELLGYSLH